MTQRKRAWIKVEVLMPEHPKVAALSDAAFRLLINFWCWCGLTTSDGVVTTAWWMKHKAGPRRELLNAGLIEVCEGGYRAHDYLEWQTSREQMDELRAKRQTSGKQGGIGRAKALASAKANGVASAVANGKQSGGKGVAEVEIEVEVEKNLSTTTLPPAAARGPRKPDEIWDALVAACKINPPDITATMRGSLNRSCAELRSVGATSAEIALRAKRYRKAMPDVALTPAALTKHWSRLYSTASAGATESVKQGW